MTPPAIQVEKIGKSFRIGALQPYEERSLLGNALATMREPFIRARSVLRGELPQFSAETFWALREVSFEIQPGEVVGIIGHNGAGKSTLLKILSRIIPPSEGRAVLRGQVAALLEVGTGFNSELTGRENVYLNGSILGMGKREIDRKLDAIIEFAGIGQYIDTPVKRYSSGMGVRLGFAVAAHLEPEILLVDEVLAVGDLAFQKKCLGKMNDVAQSGRTVIFVSHNMETILGLCPRTILLKNGGVQQDGDTKEVVDTYINDVLERSKTVALRDRDDRSGNGLARITDFVIYDATGKRVQNIMVGGDYRFEIHYETDGTTHLRYARFLFAFVDRYGRKVVHFASNMTAQDFENLPQAGAVSCTVPRFPVNQGEYTIEVKVAVNGIKADFVQNALTIDVLPGDFFGTQAQSVGMFLCEQNWQYGDAS